MTLSQTRITNSVLGINLDAISYTDAVANIILLGKKNTPSYICFVNVHMTIEAYKNASFAKQINEATMALPDGMPIVKFLRLSYGNNQERIAGMDLMPDLIRASGGENLKLFFFGTTIETLSRIEKRVREECPNANIAGMLAPPFNKNLDDPCYITTINESGANLVFVALGCPKQEKWMASNSNKINAVLLGVGGAFPVFAGESKRAPEILRNLSLEWAYRLWIEPRRLFMRYFKTNTLFIYLGLKHILSSDKRKYK